MIIFLVGLSKIFVKCSDQRMLWMTNILIGELSLRVKVLPAYNGIFVILTRKPRPIFCVQKCGKNRWYLVQHLIFLNYQLLTYSSWAILFIVIWIMLLFYYKSTLQQGYEFANLATSIGCCTILRQEYYSFPTLQEEIIFWKIHRCSCPSNYN